MKSKIFTNNPVVTKGFSDELEIVADTTITSEMLCILPRSISEYILAMDSKGESKALDMLRTKFPLSPKQMEAILSVGGYFLKRMEIEDSINDIMADLKTLAVIDEKKITRIQPFVKALLDECKNKFDVERLAASTQSIALKNIKAISYSVDLRPVVSNRLELGDDVAKYKPIVSNLVPVAILMIRLSGDDEFVFQMDCRTLKVLQNVLQATEKDLAETVAFVGKDKVRLL
ncbi:MAG: hypothetical protein WC476_07105 [Phycisphaerae bacterium]|jgi:hypothetical protein